MLASFDAVVISPGPGSPDAAENFGICDAIIRASLELGIPLLGICLGHQGIAQVHGCQIVKAKVPVHGLSCDILHDDTGIFTGIPSPFKATRYHSLAVKSSCLRCGDHSILGLGLPLRLNAWCHDQGELVVMALQHSDKPVFGVQFHPESICSTYGLQLMINFLKVVATCLKQAPPLPAAIRLLSTVQNKVIALPIDSGDRFVAIRKSNIKLAQVFAETIFTSLFSEKTHSVWLDSSKRGRFSIMAGADNFLSVKYNLCEKLVCVSGGNSKSSCYRILCGTFFEWFEQFSRPYETNQVRFVGEAADIPFEFRGGFVGYFGYEMYVESNSWTKSQKLEYEELSEWFDFDRIPDASFLLVQNALVCDNSRDVIYMLSSLPDNSWFEDAEKLLSGLESGINSSKLRNPAQGAVKHPLDEEHMSSYLNAIEKAKSEITEGNSYELCLTTQWQYTFDQTTDPYLVYLTLRANNPAPYAAFLRMDSKLTIASSSPERFLAANSEGLVSMKPIKGTISRVFNSDGTIDEKLDEINRSLLANSQKDRAENLMIVDLIRNDLNTICKDVHVSKLMEIETFETVHQMVTEVNGKTSSHPISMLKSCFPPGSMTGAPKKKSVEILHELENHQSRGIYSGVLGYFSHNRACDFSVVIRTAVFDGYTQTVSVGAGSLLQSCASKLTDIGGAITILSDSEAEYAEMKLKANSVLPSLLTHLATTLP